MEKYLHIICFNVPYPVDYGGVFDLFYKLPALRQQGVKIHLHCFEYGRGEQPALNEYCEEVHYYKRMLGLKGLSLHLPYIVASRRNEDLLKRLSGDNYPILIEGVHCTYLLNDVRFAERICLLRLHNVEHIYYKNLCRFSSSLFKKAYYLREAKLLLNYEKSIASKVTCLPVIKKDGEIYRRLGSQNVEYIPLFLPAWKIKSNLGTGTFCLYHGNLSVEENNEAALWLFNEVFSNVDIPFVIAGKEPSSKLLSFSEKRNNICVVANPTEKEMQDMIEKAQINIIPSFNNTGIKLKLVNALYNGRHCLVNAATVEGTKLEDACYIAHDSTSFIKLIDELYHKPFSIEEVNLRHQLLDEMFNNAANAQLLINVIWGENN